MFEHIIFANLLENEDYGRKVIPFLKKDLFKEYSDKIIFELINDYTTKYNKFPSKETLLIELSNKHIEINEEQFKKIKEVLGLLKTNKNTDLQWLIDKTEEYVQEKELYNAIFKSIEIIDDKNGKHAKGSIPKMLSDALAVSFDSNIGHDFLEDIDNRYDFYHKQELKIPFDLEYFNLITKGGLPNKTLNIILAGTGVGKSLFMCHNAASNLTLGKNVLYITLEMAEERIAERIDANLLDVRLDDLTLLPKDVYVKKVEKVKSKTVGKLIIKEYPTASAGSANFRYLLNELKIKKNFIPDIIYIDYLNICSSSRIKGTAAVNSYTYIKAIAEELRGLAVEFNVPIVSATQTNRSGFSSSDVDLTDTSESFGLPATADFMFAIISSEELEQMNQLMVKQLKNRYNDPVVNKRFVIGVDRAKMRLYNVENSAQSDILDGPVMDNSKFMIEENNRQNKFKKKPSFEGFV
jgi:replicative DNA helicase